MGAANRGYVWPRVLLAADGDSMQLWSAPSPPDTTESVSYVNGLDAPASRPLAAFEQDAARLIENTLARLTDAGRPTSDLAVLWQALTAERDDHAAARYRRAEAALGFDPDEAPAARI